MDKVKTKILQISNLSMLLPNYPHFFIVTADIAPKTGASHVESSL